jgi:hypothetical protein
MKRLRGEGARERRVTDTAFPVCTAECLLSRTSKWFRQIGRASSLQIDQLHGSGVGKGAPKRASDITVEAAPVRRLGAHLGSGGCPLQLAASRHDAGRSPSGQSKGL